MSYLEESDHINESVGHKSKSSLSGTKLRYSIYIPDLAHWIIKYYTEKGYKILDPFMGSGTTAIVAKQHNRNYLGIELNEEYIEIAKREINKVKEPSQEDEILTKLFE